MKTAAHPFRQPALRAAAAADSPETTSRSELVYRQLRAALASGALKPGQRVMEVEVAEWLRVSRTPVRDALRRLVRATPRPDSETCGPLIVARR